MSASAVPHMPSAKGLLLRLIASAVVGTLIVVAVVLPAEYHLDPTGFGRLTGLINMSAPPTEVEKNTAPAAEAGSAPEPVLPKNAWFYPEEFHSNEIDIALKPDGELEYKVFMKTAGTMVYSWSANQGKVYYDFHGEPTSDPQNATRYREEQDGAATAHGGFIAPFDGIHGWYFLNLTNQPQVVKLKVSGFYQLRQHPAATVIR